MSREASEATYRDVNDLELARLVAAGDTGAFEVILRRHNRTLFRTARAILHDDTEAEDCLQSAWLLAYRAIGRFGGEARLSTWLVRIVVNEAIGRSRRIAKRGAEVAIGLPGEEDDAVASLPFDGPGPEEQLLQAEAQRSIERRIRALPTAYRVVFMLRAVDELSVEETADRLGIAPSTVRTRLFRARGLLQERVARA